MSSAQEILYGGAAGGGKSYLIRVSSIIYSLEIPGLVTYLFRRTFKEVLANHVYTPGGYLEMLADLIREKECIFSKSDFSFTFRNGSRIQLAHSQYEGDIYAHQGAQIGYLIIDEATHFTPAMIRFIRSRVRLGSMTVPDRWKGLFPRILYASNPGGVGHHYFKSNFVDHGKDHVFQAPEDEGSMTREFIPAKLTDNKVLMLNDPSYHARLKGMGDTATVQAMLEGDWEAMSSGGFADMWRSAYHVINDFKIPNTWRIDRGYDYGSAAPAVALWFAESDGDEFIDSNKVECWVPKGTIFVIGEVYLANKRHEGLRLPAAEQAKRIMSFEKDQGWKRVEPGPADNSIFSSEPGHTAIADDMAMEGALFCRSIKSPGSRVNGVDVMRRRLSAAIARPMERPGVIFFESCYHCIRTIPNLESDEKKIEDIDTTGEDHCWDVVRYRLLKADKACKKIKVEGA